MEKKFSSMQKVMSLQDLLFVMNSRRIKGLKIGFTNGCFDILHKGHVTYLEEAKKNCSFLIVGVNSDASVKRLNKGENRPINSEADRAAVLAGLASVDAIIIFDESTPAEIIAKTQPDVLFKGGDYNADSTDKNDPNYIVGSELVRSKGGKVMTIPFVQGYSTSSILEKSKG